MNNGIRDDVLCTELHIKSVCHPQEYRHHRELMDKDYMEEQSTESEDTVDYYDPTDPNDVDRERRRLGTDLG